MVRSFQQRLWTEVRAYRLALSDPRTPKAAKWLLRFAFVYLLSPLDLVPDAIPVLGLLDDLLIIPGLLFAARWLMPRTVLADCRRRASGATPSFPAQS
jgi:uncharacterized membrane protein YkvA (DUF1232 family)